VSAGRLSNAARADTSAYEATAPEVSERDAQIHRALPRGQARSRDEAARLAEAEPAHPRASEAAPTGFSPVELVRIHAVIETFTRHRNGRGEGGILTCAMRA
jgi:hypothetical protein